MSHTIELKDCNVVVVANNFNVPIINTIWLYKNNIFTEKELHGATCLPVIVDIKTQHFKLNLVPERLQFSIEPGYNNIKELMLSKIGRLVEMLPHTPFVAAGLNFIYHVTPEDGDMYTLGRSIFCNNQSKLFEDLDSKDVRFGGYFSKDLIDTSFSLNAKPITIKTEQSIHEKFQFSYNFNVNLNRDEGHEKIIALINKWDEANTITQNYNAKIV